MRILVLSNLFPPVVRGGYEVECHDFVEHLREEHDVVVLTSDHRRSETVCQADVLRVMPFADDDRAGVLKAPVHALRGVRTMRRVLAGQRPDLVYVWNGAGMPHAALHTLHRSGLPVAYRICERWFGRLYAGDLFMRFLLGGQRGHNAAWAVLIRAVNRLPALRLYEHAAVDVAVCWNSEYLKSTVPVPTALRVVWADVVHPITATADAMGDVPRSPAVDPPGILFVGRVAPQKGIDAAIRAVAELEHRHGRVATLCVVGDGDEGYRRELERLAAAQGVGARVSFAGSLRGAELHAEIARASAWVFPSAWGEAAGMVAVEAGLARVPLIASRVGGIPELLREPGEALLFEPGDSAGCAAALAETLGGGSTVDERVRRAEVRARQLSYGPYLDKMDRFLNAATAALHRASPD